MFTIRQTHKQNANKRIATCASNFDDGHDSSLKTYTGQSGHTENQLHNEVRGHLILDNLDRQRQEY